MAAAVLNDGVVDWANEAMTKLLGGDPSGSPLVDLVAPTSAVHAMHVLDAGETRTVALRTVDDGECVVDLSSARSSDGAIVLFAHRSRLELEVLEDLAKKANDLLGQGVIIGDAKRVLHVSPTAARIFGRSADDLRTADSIFDFFEESERARITELVTSLHAAGKRIPEHYETVIVRPDGSQLPIDLSIKVTVRRTMVRTFTIITDATERRAKQRELAHRALHDDLTGLPNRYLLRERLEMTLHRLDREPGEGSLLLIDLDRFKEVNDRHGHAAGDEVLRTLASRLQESVRSGDTAARIGGDEFVVLSGSAAHSETIDVLADRIRERLIEPVMGRGWVAQVGASIGTITFTDASQRADELLARVDEAMYAEKHKSSGARSPA